MSSPPRRTRYVPGPTPHRIAEPSLPLHLALAWLAVRVLPFIGPGIETIYSSTFTASILEIITVEVLELGDGPISYQDLLIKVDPLIKEETAKIQRMNERLESRAVVLSPERAEAGEFSNWVEDFVCFAS